MKTTSWATIVFLIICINVFGQTERKFDIIFLKVQTKLEVKIVEVSTETIKYKKSSDPEGPIFVIEKVLVHSIIYGNGETEVFDNSVITQEYFNPTTPTNRIEKSPAPIPRNTFEKELFESKSDNLQAMFRQYKKQSKNGLALGIGGISAGIIAIGVGAGLIIKNTDPNGNYISAQAEQNVKNGAFLMLGGFAGSATLGTIGFVRMGKNGSKAGKVKRELLRRGERLQVSVLPKLNIPEQSAGLSLVAQF